MTIKIGVLNLGNHTGDVVHLTNHNRRGGGHEVDLKRGDMHEIWVSGEGAVSFTVEGCHTQGDGVDAYKDHPVVTVEDKERPE